MEKETRRDSLQVQFMGAVELRYGGTPLEIPVSSKSKASHLLMLLLYNAGAGIARTRLLDALYRGEDADAANSLKALMFRLRRQLAASGLPAVEYINVKNGMYCFTDEIELISDAGSLKALAAQLEPLTAPDERAAVLARIAESYHGEFLPMFSGEQWVVFENVYFQDLYCAAVRELGAYHTARREYEVALALFHQAASFFPFQEEWIIGSINCLIALGRYSQALNEYEQTAAMLFDELGVYPSEQLLDCIRAISDTMLFSTTTATNINDMLQDFSSGGAYYSSYPSFIDSYRILRRIMERDKIDSCLVLCSVVKADGSPLEERDRLTEAIQILRAALRQALRKSDMFTRFSPSQMLVMFWGAPAENAHIGISRINELYAVRGGEQIARISYKVLSGNEPPQQILLPKAPRRAKPWKKLDDRDT